MIARILDRTIRRPAVTRCAIMLLLLLVTASSGQTEPIPLVQQTDKGSFPPPNKVKIVRDTYGVPHIYARNEAALMYGFGYAIAEDRLIQLVKTKFGALGQLAMIEGQGALETDMVIRSFGLAQKAQQLLAQSNPAIIEKLVGYTNGINQYMLEHVNEIPPGIPPFEPSDIFAILLAHHLGFCLNDIFDGLYNPNQGSNGFAVAPWRSANGKALLAMDSHEPYDGPTVYYEAHLTTPEYSVAGAVIPGLPAIAMGHNRHLAFTATANRPDLGDVYRFWIDPADPSRYESHDGWRTFSVRNEVFYFVTDAGMQQTEHTILTTEVGPVLGIEQGYAFAARVVSNEIELNVEELLDRRKSRNLEEFRASLQRSPDLRGNYVVADTNGNIGYFYEAIVPYRHPDLDWTQPVAGEDPRSQWGDFIPWDVMPKVVNPDSGWLMNCNDDPWWVTDNSGIDPAELPYGIGRSGYGDRGIRISDLLRNDDDVNFSRFKRMSRDIFVLRAQLLVPAVVEAFDLYADEYKLRQTITEDAVQLLQSWNYQAAVSSTAMALFDLWFWGGELGWIVSPDQLSDEVKAELLYKLSLTAEAMLQYYGQLDPHWGDIHYLSRGGIDFGIPGWDKTLRSAWGQFPADGHQQVGGGSAYHMIVKLSRPPRAKSGFPMSISDNPASPHHTDLTERFSERKYKRLWFTWAEVRDNTASVVTLDVQ